MVNKDSRIYVAGHRGLVGAALVRLLEREGYHRLLLRTHAELDLTRQEKVETFFREEKPEYVFVAAAKVGGIHANFVQAADFIYQNLMIAANTVKAAADYDTKKLLFLGSTCIYPRLAPQPMKEEYLLSGPLEPTNEAYAISKIAGLKLCEKFYKQYQKCFISAMPTNLYGPCDSFHPENSHVIPGMMRRIHEAKVQNLPEVKIWGTGKAFREFLHVDDLASALFLLMKDYDSPETINIGTGVECTTGELAETIKSVVGFHGKLVFDPTKPDGPPRKISDISKITKMGWKAAYDLRRGLEHEYQWALENRALET